MKRILLVIIVLCTIGTQKSFAWITYLQNQGTPVYTYYLGDYLEYIFYFAVNEDTSPMTVSYGVGTSTDGTGWTWRAAEWSHLDGSNRYWKSKASEHQFTSTGNWYYSGRFVWNIGGYTEYASGDWAGGRTTLSAGSYFTVNALENPTSLSATTFSSTQVNLSWTAWNSKNVMIVRKKSNESWTEPTQGTAYAQNNTIGNGVVVFIGAGTGFDNTGLLSSTGYDYKFYSVNNNYYSAGATVSATTNTGTTDYFRTKASGEWSATGTWESSANNSEWVSATLTPAGSANTTTILSTHAVTVTTAAIAGGLTINSGGTLTINDGKSLTVNGTLTNTAASGLIVKSGGSLIQSSASVAATVERDVAGWGNPTNDHGWHFLSSPVASQAIDPAFTDPTSTEYDFFAWWEATNVWVNYKNTTTEPTWSTGNVLGGTSGAGNFIPGKGYLVEYKDTDTKQFTGTLNKDDIPVSNLVISSGTNRGWHLLGNPYPSALNWGTTAWSLTNINATAKIWKESTAAYIDISNGGPNTLIPALNGFMVQVTNGFSGNNSLTIPESERVPDATAWYKSGDRPHIILAARDINGNTEQESIILFSNEATAGFDPEFDSHFLSGYAPKFYSVAGDEHLSTNALPESGGTVQIPFEFIKNDATGFAIEARKIDNLFGPVILNDLKTNATQDLTLNPVYPFTSETGDTPARFILSFNHVGLSENQAEPPVSITANGNEIRITSLKGTNLTGEVMVYTLTGQCIAHENLTGTTITKITLPGSAGIHLVKVVTDTFTHTGKIHLNH